MRPTTVVIPARGGSQRIPRKNLADFRGRPLIMWSIDYALSEGYTPLVVTDDAEIKALAIGCGAKVVDEPERFAMQSQYQPLLRWLAAQLQSDLIVLQATSPIRRKGMIQETIAALQHHDSVASAVRLPVQFVVDQHGRNVNGRVKSDGTMPQSQEIAGDPHSMISGAIFGSRYPQLLREPYCLFGRVGLIEHPLADVVDVDYPQDLQPPTVCVVGSGVNLRHRRLGWLIDRYDVVVRINWYDMQGWEQTVGSKTTHWALVCSPTVVDALEGRRACLGEFRTDCSEFVAVWPRYGGHDGSYDRVLSHLSHWRQLERICGWDDSIKQFARWNSDRQRLPTPTTGVVAIAKAIDKWGVRVDVAGFGDRDVVELGHYSGKVALQQGCHDFDAERLLLNDWEADGLIRRIDG